jgi:hypothetical protein
VRAARPLRRWNRPCRAGRGPFQHVPEGREAQKPCLRVKVGTALEGPGFHDGNEVVALANVDETHDPIAT